MEIRQAIRNDKKNQKKYALMTLIQILLLLSLPTYARLSQVLALNTGVTTLGYMVIGILFIGSVLNKQQIQAKLRK